MGRAIATSTAIRRRVRRCPACRSLCAVESTSRPTTAMENSVEPNRPPALGNLPASFPFATSLERIFPAQECERSLVVLVATFLTRSYAVDPDRAKTSPAGVRQGGLPLEHEDEGHLRTNTRQPP